MAFVARFGFENNNMLPDNVSLVENNLPFNVSRNKFTSGRNGGTALIGYGYSMFDTTNQITKSFCSGVSVKTIPIDQVYLTYYCKLISSGAVNDHTSSLIKFGDTSVKFNPYNSTFMVCVTESIVKTGSFDWPVDSWVQVKCGIGLGESKQVFISLNEATLTSTINTAPNGIIYSDNVNIYSGMTQSIDITGIPGYQQISPNNCTFAIDDIAVNNSLNFNGANNISYPPFISCIKLIPSMSSITTGWQSSTTASIIESLSDTSSFIRGNLSDSPQLVIFPSGGIINQLATLSAMNISYFEARREGQAQLTLNAYPKYSACPAGVSLSATKSSTTNTLTPANYSQFDVSKLFSYGIPIKYSKFKDYNYFGKRTLGNVRYTSSVVLGEPNQFTVLEYDNLIIDSSSTISKALTCKGLFFYVNDTFILSGTILASNGMTSSADITGQSDFIYFKNTKPIDLNINSNISNTLEPESTNQPVLSGSTISADLSIYKKNLIGSTFATYYPGANGSAGYGGSACNAFNSNGAIFGQMASSSIYGGGMAVNNYTSSTQYTRYYGGGLVGVVAKNILIASTGKLLCSGTVSQEQWYGSGGGIVRFMYSNTYTNSGTVSVAGAGSYGKGGNGTVLTTKISSLVTGDTGIKCLLHFDSASIVDECKLATISLFGGAVCFIGTGSVATSSNDITGSNNTITSQRGLYSGMLSQDIPTQDNTGLTTWVNQGTATSQTSSIGLSINATTTGATTQLHCLVRSVPTSSYTITALIAHSGPIDKNYPQSGFGWRNSSTGKISAFCFDFRNGASGYLSITNFTNATTYDSAIISNNYYGNGPYWVRLVDNGTTVFFKISFDCVNWFTYYSVTKSSGYLGGSGYNQICLFTNPHAYDCATTLMSWKIE